MVLRTYKANVLDLVDPFAGAGAGDPPWGNDLGFIRDDVVAQYLWHDGCNYYDYFGPLVRGAELLAGSTDWNG